MTARAHVFFSGRVQGVFFRANTLNKAVSLGLTGWVRNLPDNRVEAVFEGEKTAIEEVIKHCAESMPPSHVDQVEAQWKEPKGEGTFEIR